MNRRTLMMIASVGVGVVALCMWLTERKVSAQIAAQLSTPVYNPYPPGILPSDFSPEVARVLGEVNFIETEAIPQWHALTPPTLTGNPPIPHNTADASVAVRG